jgi:hypothetical protein
VLALSPLQLRQGWCSEEARGGTRQSRYGSQNSSTSPLKARSDIMLTTSSDFQPILRQRWQAPVSCCLDAWSSGPPSIMARK